MYKLRLCRWEHLRESDVGGIDSWLHARDLWEPGEDDALNNIAKVVVPIPFLFYNGGSHPHPFYVYLQWWCPFLVL